MLKVDDLHVWRGEKHRDGTTHIFFEPLDFIARLAALVPSPRVHLIRYHGVFAPNHRSRADITQAKRGKRFLEWETKTPAESRAAMSLKPSA